MKNSDGGLQRLLRSAAQVSNDEPVSTPFGFDTRVIALWRAGHGNGSPNGLAGLVRRVAALAAIVILVSSTASFYELQAARDSVEIASNDFAIADSAIETEFDP